MKINVIDGHPDKSERRFCHAIAGAYTDGARESGHEVRTTTLAGLEIPPLRSQEEWVKGTLPDCLQRPQEAIKWADHIVIIYPLWLGDMPAYLKAFLEQVARPGFAFEPSERSMKPGPLKGRSAHIIVTMGMPALVYKWFFFKHSLTSLKRNILEFVGIKPVRETVIGAVESTDHGKWLEKVKAMGRSAK